MVRLEIRGDIDGTVKAQNAEFFSADITAQKTGIFRLMLSLSATKVVDVTFDSGSNWTALNDGTSLTTDQLYAFDVMVKVGDTFNMRIPTASGATVDVGRVFFLE